jgi:uncharacterized protein YprB with RNaseH-like and TPR domain
MAGNLRNRLLRIQQTRQSVQNKPAPVRQKTESSGREIPGWESAGYLTLKRVVACEEPLALPGAMPEAAGIVMPGAGGAVYENLLFFDLETTGLSHGAGTVAFLAAFGRLCSDPAAVGSGRKSKTSSYTLRVTQYLLLDYPGEYDFVCALLGEIKNESVIVSYNGKCFDSQILKTRCLMNGLTPPEYRHADLLFTSRRLWKRILPNCSQAVIETNILGIDRSGDIPGAMAPDIWFSFLKNGDAEPLLGICEHNRKDIAGLASIFSALAAIADDPFAAAQKIKFDLETLSLRWYERTQSACFAGCPEKNETDIRLRETGQKLLEFAAETGCPRACLHYAFTLFKAGRHEAGRRWLHKSVHNGETPAVQTAALRALAIDSEHRAGNLTEALEFAERGLELLPPESPLRKEFEYRKQRLQKKLASSK